MYLLWVLSLDLCNSGNNFVVLEKKDILLILKIVTLLTSCNYTILDTYQGMIAQNTGGRGKCSW